MHYVLAYDIVANRRRARFFKKLKAFLVPVQKSVFEGPMDARGLARVEKLIHSVLDLEEDAVRIYALNKASVGLTRSYGVQPDLRDADAPIVL